MNLQPLIAYVHEENEGQPSLKDQVRALVVMSQYGYQRSGALKSSEIAEHAKKLNIEFDHDLSTVLGNLTDIEALDRYTPSGPDYFVISERQDDIINGEFEENVDEDREALISHIQESDPAEDGTPAAADGGVTLRDVVANALGVVPEGLEAHLRGGEYGDQRKRLNTAVEAIADHEDFDKRDTYGKITLRRSAYRYHFTAHALSLVNE